VPFMTGLFIVILAGILAGTVAEIAKAIARRGASPLELASLKQQLEQQAAALEEVESTVVDQTAQLAELHERVDFAERLLAQARDRPALGAGDKRG
jgi:chromosome segregation ATPase